MRANLRQHLPIVLCTCLLLGGLVAPSASFALVGEPVPGAEVFLQQQPGDDPIMIGIELGGHEVNADCDLSWPDGTVAAPTPIVALVGYSSTGQVAADAGVVKRIVKLTPDGTTFLKPITLRLACPPGLNNPRMYVKNPSTGVWQSVTSSRSGDKVLTQIEHFSIYGVGGDPVLVTSTAASSEWSLALLAVVGLAFGVYSRRRLAA